jgi:hypothetical protein
LLRLSLYCKEKKCDVDMSGLIVTACDCTKCPLDNLPDLMIVLMSNNYEDLSATKIIPHFTPGDLIFFGREFSDSLESFFLQILDSLLLVKEEDMCVETRRIRNRAREIVEMRQEDSISEAYAACRRHFTGGDRRKLEGINEKCFEELPKERERYYHSSFTRMSECGLGLAT